MQPHSLEARNGDPRVEGFSRVNPSTWTLDTVLHAASSRCTQSYLIHSKSGHLSLIITGEWEGEQGGVSPEKGR